MPSFCIFHDSKTQHTNIAHFQYYVKYGKTKKNKIRLFFFNISQYYLYSWK